MFRTSNNVLFLFALCAALAFIASSPAASAQQSAGAGSQSKPDPAASPAPAQSASGPRISDLAWLEGRWRADWGPRVAEQVWMAPKAGMILGDFRLIENDKVLVIEFFSLVERPGGINFYLRHFTPELAPWEKSDATMLNLAAADAGKFDFENPANSRPKRVSFTRIDADTYTAHSEIIPQSGDPQTIEITYHRQPLAAVAPNSPAGAHPKKK